MLTFFFGHLNGHFGCQMSQLEISYFPLPWQIFFCRITITVTKMFKIYSNHTFLSTMNVIWEVILFSVSLWLWVQVYVYVCLCMFVSGDTDHESVDQWQPFLAYRCVGLWGTLIVPPDSHIHPVSLSIHLSVNPKYQKTVTFMRFWPNLTQPFL